MKKTSLLIILTMLLGILRTNAQVEFMHALGAEYIFASSQGNTGGEGAICYSPRVIVTGSDNFSISVGTHIAAGLSFNSETGSGGVAFDFPLMGEANFGLGATKEADGGIGGFGGLGFALITAVATSDGDGNGASYSGMGPVIDAGVRFAVKNRSFGVRLAYEINIKSGGGSAFYVHFFYTFGELNN